MRSLSILFAVALVSTTACKSGDEPYVYEPPTITPGPTGETGDPPRPDLTGNMGSIYLRDRLASAGSDPYTEGWAIFGTEDAGLVNFSACLFFGSPCVDAWPAEGTSTAGIDINSVLTNFAYVEADPVSVAGTSLPELQGFPDPIYVNGLPSFAGSGDVSFDGDLAPYTGTGVFEFPDAIELTAPVPTERLRVGPGGTIDLAWTPGGTGSVYLTDSATLWSLADTGAFSIGADELGLTGPIDTVDLVLSRTTHVDLDAAGNELGVMASSEQVIAVDFVDPGTFVELTLDSTMAEDCAGAATLLPLLPGDYWGDLAGFAADHDPGDSNALTGWAAVGGDAVVKVNLNAGQALTVQYTLISGDSSMYLLTDACDIASGLTGADDTFFNEEEVLDWTATEDASVYLVLDDYYASPGLFTLTLSILN